MKYRKNIFSLTLRNSRTIIFDKNFGEGPKSFYKRSAFALTLRYIRFGLPAGTVSTPLSRPSRICLDLRSNSERLHYGD